MRETREARRARAVRRRPVLLAAAVTVMAVLTAYASAAEPEAAAISIDATGPGIATNPHMYGVLIEEINHGVDGGLYAELIRNRGFEESEPPEGYRQIGGRWLDRERGYDSGYTHAPDALPGWSLVESLDSRATVSLCLDAPLSAASPRSLRLEVGAVGAAGAGVANAGYWGIGVREQAEYRLSLWVRAARRFAGPVRITLEDATGAACAQTVEIAMVPTRWTEFRANLRATRTRGDARLVVRAFSPGTLWLDQVSLFPARTYRGRPNGLRPDLAQMIADLKPGFVRFPGGCIVEGGTVETAYDWKDSLGPLRDRPETWGVWGARRTHGMGYFEYLQYCEDLGAEPLPVLFAGQTCIYRHAEHVPMDAMGPVVDGYLDLLEYTDGPADSRWGRLRAAAGHPAPFGVRMLEIGNENVGPEYEARYAVIYEALKAKHPEIGTVSCVLQPSAPTEMVDEHYYNSPRWFLDHADLYDGRDRSLPPVYVGEVAVTSDEGGPDKGNLRAALAEGAFLLGLERNADAVRMVSYAPLLGHVSGRSGWHGMIYFDSLRAYGTASYHLWKLFGNNLPSRVFPTEVAEPETALPGIAGAIGLGTWDTAAEYRNVRVERGGETLYAASFADGAPGWTTEGGRWTAEGGAWGQREPATGLSYAGEEDWSDYTLRLEARKLSGAEGFLIAFGRRGGDTYWWNLGGWGNREHGIELNRSPVGRRVPGRIETNRWYDIRIELTGRRIRCFLDGVLVHDEQPTSARSLFALAGRDDTTGELVLKVINVAEKPVAASLRLEGVRVTGMGAVTVLRAASLDDNNSLDEPLKVAPQTQRVRLEGDELEWRFPARSLTVLRVPAR